MSAAYEFTDRCFIYIDIDGGDYLIEMEIKPGIDSKPEVIAGEFWNELLTQQVRVDVSKESKSIRELVLTRALYSSYLEPEENNISLDGTNEGAKYSLNDIAKDWFEDDVFTDSKKPKATVVACPRKDGYNGHKKERKKHSHKDNRVTSTVIRNAPTTYDHYTRLLVR